MHIHEASNFQMCLVSASSAKFKVLASGKAQYEAVTVARIRM